MSAPRPGPGAAGRAFRREAIPHVVLHASAYTLLHGKVGGLSGKLRFTALALPLVMIVTATYHLGYPQYRQDSVSRPETGNVLISIPAFATANPVGSFVAHASQHIAAVTHAYESRIFNPPATKS